MGICISAESSEIHHESSNLATEENVTVYESSKNVNLSKIHRLSSIHSKKGSKGLNQDAATLCQGYGMEDAAFCGVFDGHGRNGRIVSQIVNKRLSSLILDQKNMITHAKNDNNTILEDDDSCTNKNFQEWKEAILCAFRVMDMEVNQLENLDFSCSGTTAIVAIRQSEDLIMANLGDSRAVLGTICDGEIIPIQLTTDMKPGLPREADRIRSCNGRVFALHEEPHIQRVWLPNENSPGLAMSRAFGDFILKDHGIIAIPEISFRPLTSSDQFVVLASDGVWDVLSNIEVCSIVWTTENEAAAAKAVVEAATAAWKSKYPSSKVDDCTAVCLFLQKKQRSLVYVKTGNNVN
ncbi:hypothetical protein HN51_018710 [Arachis hypogaea]|uniref:PPM-type phosphatase domain-containing protein n=2 Tax=Arachis TaxID=3817 RepID=A0A445BUH4_ARAHY|nr:probable protein phosphatase 2C 72 [Arachis duranensis]XP_025613438.1 probable protein phosphatase 2C 72 [Arachis hypogaea]RYR42292.1 hypothetical protein Ahy_A08g038760 [Arachis hypogaea]